MATQTTRRQRVMRALTPKRVRRAQVRWRRRAKKVGAARAKVRGVWRGEPVVNGRRPGKSKPRPQRQPQAAWAKQSQKQAQRGRAKTKAKPVLPEQPKCDGTCTNSGMDPEEAKAKGLCGTCCGRKELVTTFRGKHLHAPCKECDQSGLASVAARKKANRSNAGRSGGKAGARQPDQPQRPTRREAGEKAAPWLAIGSALMAAFVLLPLSPWFIAAGAGAMAVGAVTYRHERKHGTTNHAGRTDRQAVKQQARQAGCSSACMWSIKPASTCRCPCGGATHGILNKRKAAA